LNNLPGGSRVVGHLRTPVAVEASQITKRDTHPSRQVWRPRRLIMTPAHLGKRQNNSNGNIPDSEDGGRISCDPARRHDRMQHTKWPTSILGTACPGMCPGMYLLSPPEVLTWPLREAQFMACGIQEQTKFPLPNMWIIDSPSRMHGRKPGSACSACSACSVGERRWFLRGNYEGTCVSNWPTSEEPARTRHPHREVV
jgi:hypothetical protein